MSPKRREFLTMIAGMGAASPFAADLLKAQQPPAPNPVRQEWLNLREEPILEPSLPIIDPHHHLWVRGAWRYLIDELLVDTASGHNIVATVFVQARSMYRNSGPEEIRPVGETEFVNGVAAMCASGYCGKTRVAAGIVGHADLRLGRRAEPVLLALMRAGGEHFRGIRHITAWDADTSLNNPAYPAPPGLLGDETFREGFALLGKHGLSFDAWLYHPQIGELADLAGTFPNIKIVLNHCGGPIGSGAYQGKRDEVFLKWRASIRALAAHPNVFVKVGGLGQAINGIGLNELPKPPSSEVLVKTFRPYVETCIDAFGASRSMFESNFPVDKVSYSYPVFWNACKLLAKNASRTEKADLFSGTAARFYRLTGVI